MQYLIKRAIMIQITIPLSLITMLKEVSNLEEKEDNNKSKEGFKFTLAKAINFNSLKEGYPDSEEESAGFNRACGF